MSLEWRQHETDATCWVTKCGRYSVSTRQGVWDAWKLAPGGPWFAPLRQNLADEASAKAVAEADAK